MVCLAQGTSVSNCSTLWHSKADDQSQGQRLCKHQGSQVLTGSGRDHRQSWMPKEPQRQGDHATWVHRYDNILGREAVCFASYYILLPGQSFFGIWARSLQVNPVPIRNWNNPRSCTSPLNPFRSHQGGMVTRCEGPMDTGTAPTLRPTTVALGKVPCQPPARKL